MFVITSICKKNRPIYTHKCDKLLRCQKLIASRKKGRVPYLGGTTLLTLLYKHISTPVRSFNLLDNRYLLVFSKTQALTLRAQLLKFLRTLRPTILRTWENVHSQANENNANS